MGWDLRTARRISLATCFMAGRRRVMISLFTRNSVAEGSARRSMACSISSLTAEASPPQSLFMDLISTWIWLLRKLTSPMTRTIISLSISGWARTPALSKAAQKTRPLSSATVNMVGPPVCLTWITSPLIMICFPTIFVSSEAR